MNSVEGYKGFVTFLILFGIVLTATLSFTYIIEPESSVSKASEEKLKPLQLESKNISSDRAEISWITQDKVAGKVLYSEDWSNCEDNSNPKCIVVDLPNEETSHSAVLNGLNQQTTYYYKVQSGQKTYPEGDAPSFTTQHLSETGILAPIQVEKFTNDELDYSGLIDVKHKEDIDQPEVVLGVQVSFPEPEDPLSEMDELVIEEFREAMIYQDTRYDFNNDGTVSAQDYPLFMDFILNKED